MNNGINYLSTGAGFLPSTVMYTVGRCRIQVKTMLVGRACRHFLYRPQSVGIHCLAKAEEIQIETCDWKHHQQIVFICTKVVLFIYIYTLLVDDSIDMNRGGWQCKSPV